MNPPQERNIRPLFHLFNSRWRGCICRVLNRLFLLLESEIGAFSRRMIIPTKTFQKPDVDASPGELDQFYHIVLSSVTDLERCLDILSFFCFSNIALSLDRAVQSISDLLCHNPIDLQISLDELDAVINLPNINLSDEHPDDIKRPFRTVPEKFKKFLTDRERARQFYINPQEAYVHLTQRYLLHLPSVFPRTQGRCVLYTTCVCYD